jgi:hypothetical protein
MANKKKITGLNNSHSPNQKSKKLDSDDNKKSESNSNMSTNNITPVENKKKLYAIRETSRFDFVKHNDDNKEVPDYVCDVICKKFSRHSFFNKFMAEFEKNINDCMYFEKELKKDDSWAQFIRTNMENK